MKAGGPSDEAGHRPMKATDPVLELAAARPFFDQSALPNTRFDLRLMAGECALVVTARRRPRHRLVRPCAAACSICAMARSASWATTGASSATSRPTRCVDVSAGCRSAEHGSACCAPISTSCCRCCTTHSEPLDSLVDQAVELARQVGLPGLPIGRPEAMPEADLMRAACVRAFLGEPRLLLLEHSIQRRQRRADHVPLLNLLTRALDRGAAAICFTRDSRLWRTQAFPLAHHLHLLEDGLNPVRSVREKSRQRDATEREADRLNAADTTTRPTQSHPRSSPHRRMLVGALVLLRGRAVLRRGVRGPAS